MIERKKSRGIVEIKRVGVWIRVSTEDQAKGESPAHHKRRAELYAESKGWDIIRVYDLSGVSGKTVVNQPEAQAMLADVKSGRISGLIFSKLARLARNTRELLDFAEYFETHGADLVSIAESIDTSTPAGRFFYTLIAAMAQWEREEISSRVKASVVIRAKMGKSVGGAAPYGYKREDQKLVLDAVEAPIRKRMFELFLEHRRLKTVATEMNKAGYRTRNGSAFSDTTIRRLIEDPIAKGLRRSNYTRSTGDKKHWDLKSPEEWIHFEAEPIVPEEIWETANAMLVERKKGDRPKQRTVHLFSGLGACDCGGTLAVKWQSPNYTCTKCKRKIAIADLETIFRDELRRFFVSKEEVQAYLAAADTALTEKQSLLSSLQDESAAIRKKMDKTYTLYLEDAIGSEAFRTLYTPLEARSKQLLEELSRLSLETDFLAMQHLSSTEVVADAQDLFGRWDELSQEEKRRIVESVVRRITLGDGTVSIDLYYSPSAPPIAAVGQRNYMDSSPQQGRIARENAAMPRLVRW
jgi:site-specific DNA recombinase